MINETPHANAPFRPVDPDLRLTLWLLRIQPDNLIRFFLHCGAAQPMEDSGPEGLSIQFRCVKSGCWSRFPIDKSLERSTSRGAPKNGIQMEPTLQ